MLENIDKIPEPKTKEYFQSTPITNSSIFEKLTILKNKARGKIHVGCIVEAIEFRDDDFQYSFQFGGCNIHISDSFGDTHAERMAIDLALKDRCYPITVYVTSTSSKERVLLCGSCRHYISEINENCNIVIFNPDGTIKEVSTIKDAYPFHKDVKEKNQEIFDYCRMKK